MATELYPRVEFTTQALQRRRATVVRNTATRLLAPFICDRGPENEIVEFDNFTDFVNTYGGLSYTTEGQEQILNIGQWLNNGGVVCACRLTDYDDEKGTGTAKKTTYTIGVLSDGNSATSDNITTAKFNVKIEAKYSGSYYNDLAIGLTFLNGSNDSKRFNIAVKYKNANSGKYTTIERYNNATIETLYKFLNSSQYIGSIKFYQNGNETAAIETNSGFNAIFADGFTFDSIKDKEIDSYTADDDKGASNTGPIAQELITNQLAKAIKDRLSTPIDCFLDCGYDSNIKKAFGKLFGATAADITLEDDTSIRNDICAMFTTFVLGSGTGKHGTNIDYSNFNSVFTTDADTYNFYVSDMYGKVVDNYSSLKNGNEVEVPMLYFLAGFIPFNDAAYGVQNALAGKRRTLIGSDLLWISDNLTSSEKNKYYEAAVNYVERDQDGYAFMTQLTYTTQDTTLKFLNHERVLLKMKKDIEIIGRNYLHEINDSITKKNLLNQLNSYINNWITNRTLSSATVAIYDSTEDETLENQQILISLNIVFNRTIEIISVDITCSE